jgi:hypothetical protein
MFFEARLICLCALVLVVSSGLGVCRLVLVGIYIIRYCRITVQYSNRILVVIT